jgi:hypothetical protein
LALSINEYGAGARRPPPEFQRLSRQTGSSSADGNRAVILAISSKKLRSNTAVTRCIGAGFDENT